MNYLLNKVNSKTMSKPKLRYPLEKVFIVNESYAGKKEFAELFAELLCSAYFKQEPVAQCAARKRLSGK